MHEREKLKFTIASYSLCFCNSASSLQSLDHIGHIVLENGDLQQCLELKLIILKLALLLQLSSNDNPLQDSCLENPMDGEAW